MSRADANDPQAWLLEALQARLLTAIFSQRVHDLVLKGGMAMRLLHLNSRATKDIDLDAGADLPMQSVRTVLRRAIRQAASGDLLKNVVVTEPKQTETTARWKITGQDLMTGLPMHLTVEVSHRDHITQGDVQYVADGTGKGICVYTDQALAFKKVKALMADERDATRDVADLFLLISCEVDPPVGQLKHWLSGDVDQSVARMWHKLEGMDKKRFDADVLPTLPWHGKERAFFGDWDKVRLTVGEQVEKWLRAAAAAESTLSSDPGDALRKKRDGEAGVGSAVPAGVHP